jgi:hypothetical protein
MTIKVEILKGFHEVESRSIKQKDGTPRVLYTQKAYLHQGGAFPVKFVVNVESPALAYTIGVHSLDLDCLKVNRFGSLEVDPFNVKLKTVSQ